MSSKKETELLQFSLKVLYLYHVIPTIKKRKKKPLKITDYLYHTIVYVLGFT